MWGTSPAGPGYLVVSFGDRSRRGFPIATATLIAVNLLVFWYEFSLGEARLERFLDLWGVVPGTLSSYLERAEAHPGVLITPLTSMYLHVGVLHLAVNMLYLWVFGRPVEHQLGRVRFLLFYTVCGVLAALVQVLAVPDSAIPAVGASGAIAGLLGAFLVMRPSATLGAIAPGLFFYPTVDVAAVALLGLWCLSQMLAAFTAVGPGVASGNAAWVAHLGGLVSGLLLVACFRPRRPRKYHW